MVVYKLSHWITLWFGLQIKEKNWRYRDQDGRKLTLDNFYGLLLWSCCSLRWFAIIAGLLICQSCFSVSLLLLFVSSSFLQFYVPLFSNFSCIIFQYFSQ